MFLKSVQTTVQKSCAFKYFPSDKPMLIRHCSQKSSSHKFRSNHINRNFAFGAVAGVGISISLGIFKYSGDSRDEVKLNFENLKSKFVSYADNGSQNDNSKPFSPRASFNFLADVVEKTKHSVVYIEIITKHPYTGSNVTLSNGSGFIVKSDGLILTNAHVVNHHGHVIVELYNGQQFRAVIEDIDLETDLATIRIKADNLPTMPLGCSAKVRPGEFVIAMGNPLALVHTITFGVVSSTKRQGKDLGMKGKSFYIQTDAAVNSGNSGGPLVNLDGEAIGISVIKVAEGISLAIPSDCAAEFLKKSGNKRTWNPFRRQKLQRTQRFMGITMLALSPGVIKDLKEQSPDFPSIEHGVLIWKVIIDSPSFEQGIRPGDVITKINGVDVFAVSNIEYHMKTADIINFTIQRGANEFEVSVPLVEAQSPF